MSTVKRIQQLSLDIGWFDLKSLHHDQFNLMWTFRQFNPIVSLRKIWLGSCRVYFFCPKIFGLSCKSFELSYFFLLRRTSKRRSIFCICSILSVSWLITLGNSFPQVCLRVTLALCLLPVSLTLVHEYCLRVPFIVS